MNSNPIQFDNGRGNRLSARLEMPADNHPYAFAIFAHCFTCNKNFKAVKNISQELVQQGIAVFSFDFTGLGQSEGNFAESGFAGNVSDLKAAADYLEKNYSAPSILIGHSLGGAAVLLAATDIPSVKAIITIGAPYDPAHVKKHLQGDLSGIEKTGEGQINIGGRNFRITREFLEQLEQIDLPQQIRNLKRPLLIMHSPSDDVVGIDNAAAIYDAALHPKSFISLDNADHLLTAPADSAFAAEVLTAWSRRYVPQREKEPLQTHKRVVAAIEGHGFLTEIKVGNHGFIADEPLSYGGTDKGPTPYDLLMAAIGSCTAMTLRMYADRRKMPLDAVRVHLQQEKEHAQDCETCEKEDSRIHYISREIELEGNLNEEQKQKLVQIANKCPVHRTLQGEIRIETHLAGE